MKYIVAKKKNKYTPTRSSLVKSKREKDKLVSIAKDQGYQVIEVWDDDKWLSDITNMPGDKRDNFEPEEYYVRIKNSRPGRYHSPKFNQHKQAPGYGY